MSGWYETTKRDLYLRMQFASTSRKARQLARGIRTESDRVYVGSYDGRYLCNPKYIVEEILRRQAPFRIVWGVPDDGKYRDTFPGQVHVVVQGTDEMYREMARARFWLDNTISCTWHGMPRKPDQIYLDTFHGSMGIKKLHSCQLEADRKRRRTQPDYFLTNSTFEEWVFENTYWQGVPVLRFGHARNDVFFDPGRAEGLRQKVLRELGIPAGEKLFLYAPTFRDDGSAVAYDLDFGRIREALAERFGGSWTVLLRAHWRELGKIRERTGTDGVLDASSYTDMQELLCAADAGMTDYSSWAYDYVLSGRPMFLYARDADDYETMRGLYFPLSETPFPVCTAEAEIAEAIRTFDADVYEEKRQDFLRARGCYEDGHAAERTVDWMLAHAETEM